MPTVMPVGKPIGERTEPDALTLDDLRVQRMAARRDAELAQLRARQGGPTPSGDLAVLDTRVRALTEELIGRYAADLTLVDSLLVAPYPAKVGRANEGGRQ